MAKEDLARLFARLQAQTAVQTQRTFALQATMTCVFRELAKDPKFEEAIKSGFDAAANAVEGMAMKEGGRGGVPETIGWPDVLGRIEEFRAVTFPRGEPKRDDQP
jgi:hypothetical protein